VIGQYDVRNPEEDVMGEVIAINFRAPRSLVPVQSSQKISKAPRVDFDSALIPDITRVLVDSLRFYDKGAAERNATYLLENPGIHDEVVAKVRTMEMHLFGKRERSLETVGVRKYRLHLNYCTMEQVCSEILRGSPELWEMKQSYFSALAIEYRIKMYHIYRMHVNLIPSR
jgi:hypothetical protein